MAKPKKTPAPTHLIAYFSWLSRQKFHLLNLVLFSLIIILLPGQNRLQTLELHPQSPKLRDVDINVPPLPNTPLNLRISEPPPVTAQAVIVIDPESSAILFEKNPDVRLLPASTTKIMTALTALELYQLDEIVTITNADQSIGQRAMLIAGERLYVTDLIKAMLINSGNDAALALAQHHPEGYDAFIQTMNHKAIALHLTNTRFANVSGIETPGHYSSVRDLANLTKEAMKNDYFRSVVATKETAISDVTGTITHRLSNVNELLGEVKGLQGVKTGWTQNAGECLVTYTERHGHSIITVLLGSVDRFGESAQLIEWAYENHRWISIEELLDTNP